MRSCALVKRFKSNESLALFDGDIMVIILRKTGGRVSYAATSTNSNDETGGGISSIFPIILIAPWLISDYMGKKRNIRSPMFRILGLVGILFGFGMQFIDTTPPLLMVFSQAFQALILPAVAIPIFILINRKSLMNDHVANTKMNIGLIGVILFSLVTSYFAIIDFF